MRVAEGHGRDSRYKMEPRPVRIGRAVSSCRTSIAGPWSNANTKVESAATYYTCRSLSGQGMSV